MSCFPPHAESSARARATCSIAKTPHKAFIKATQKSRNKGCLSHKKFTTTKEHRRNKRQEQESMAPKQQQKSLLDQNVKDAATLKVLMKEDPDVGLGLYSCRMQLTAHSA